MAIADSHFLLANARIVDFPVVYCNEGLCQLSGFERSELMQKPAVCSAMHGEQTSPECIARFHNAMEQQISDQFEIQLYKKNSNTSFVVKCRVYIQPVSSANTTYIFVSTTCKLR